MYQREDLIELESLYSLQYHYKIRAFEIKLFRVKHFLRLNLFFKFLAYVKLEKTILYLKYIREY